MPRNVLFFCCKGYGTISLMICICRFLQPYFLYPAVSVLPRKLLENKPEMDKEEDDPDDETDASDNDVGDSLQEEQK